MKTAYVGTDRLKKAIERNMGSGLSVERIKEPRVACVSVQCGGADFKDVLKEGEGPGKVIDITKGSKDKNVQKVVDYIKKVFRNKIGEDAIGDEIYAYVKDMGGGSFLLYVFAGVK